MVRVGKHFIVKFGQDVDLIEGENMLFVQKTTNVAVPKIYALYTDASTKTEL
jgi:hypothetical protein